MKVLDTPLETVLAGPDSSPVLRFVEDEGHTESFGYEWEQYARTYSDAALGVPLSRNRLELNLGFPLEFIKGMNVLELGCGAGRFTTHLADYAKHVVAVDRSRAVYVNEALGRENVTLIQGDLLSVPALSEPIDLVFCRGVLQHTLDPVESMKRLFDYAPTDSLVIFDIYKKYPGDWFTFKYFWQPFFKKYIPLEKFDHFITKHQVGLYRFHHAYLKFVAAIPVFRTIIGKTPLHLGTNWEKQYSHLTQEQRYEIFKNELIDALYAGRDKPMTTEEVIFTLATIGQVPYSFDVYRNQFRYKKRADLSPLSVRLTKNGVLPARG